MSRIYLSPPSAGDREIEAVSAAIRSGWVAPAGPDLSAFEEDLLRVTGAQACVAVASGTAALHLALRVLGVTRGDWVYTSTMTFIGGVGPILYQDATPVFLDSESTTWNLDPDLLETALRDDAERGTLPAAVVVTHLYGQSAQIDRIANLCREYRVPLVEDAAESLGSVGPDDKAPGTWGDFGILSFNGNKIITTSGGGAVLARRPEDARRIRKLATQAREDRPYYHHVELGYNYRLSNLLAALGRAQLSRLSEKVQSRRRLYEAYRSALGDLGWLEFVDEPEWGRHSRWLTTCLIKSQDVESDEIVAWMEQADIEARRLWKPMHLQPLFGGARVIGGAVSEDLFARGLCLPSGIEPHGKNFERVVNRLRRAPGS